MESEELITFDEEMQNLDKGEPTFQPLYKMVSNNKIYVNKKEGALWRDRLEMCQRLNKDLISSWQTLKDVYAGEVNAPSLDLDKKRTKIYQQDKNYENLLWSNTIGINRETIMKLPHLTVDARDENNFPIARAYEHALNNYISKIGNNGLNCKEKLKKVDISAQLTNRGIWRLDWQDKTDTDAIMKEIKQLEKSLTEAKTEKEIRDIEGKLYAANEKLEASGFDGAQLTLIDPAHLYIDPNSQLESGLDADWMIEERIEFVSILKAKYGEGEGTVYAGEKSEIEGEEQEERRQELLTYASGEQTVRENENMKTVKVYYVWDKLKKRQYLYQEGKWDYPLWVWEDPYKLERFFPFYILSYNFGPVTNNMLPEAAYYLPIMNSINKINSLIDKARDRASSITLIDKKFRMNEKDAQNIADGKPGYVMVDIPEGKRVSDGLTGMITPGLEQSGLLNKVDLYSSIAKIGSADNITRGEEYRTNTTNLAIQQYTSGKKIIIGVRIDAILSFFSDVAKDILKLMVDKFDESDWLKQCSPDEVQLIVQNKVPIDNMFRVYGDDTIEPTAAVKKQEAIQLAQILGQFAAATPAVSIVVLKAMSKAFNEIVITDKDWEMIFASMQQQQQPAPQMPPEAMQQAPDEGMVQQAAQEVMEGQAQ